MLKERLGMLVETKIKHKHKHIHTHTTFLAMKATMSIMKNNSE